ncbi:hypothetical protein EVC30_158 [Rhizobium phage RHph_Y1_11]|nr:hypothetical protein EVC30_158 [Rhizobium phage RHph_Y1_11]
MAVLLSTTATLQAAMESVYGTPASVGNTDAVLVEEPQFTVDVQTLDRNFLTANLSPKAIINGRKIAGMTFTLELRGNNKEQSGLSADAPIISRLFRACGFALTASAAKSVLVKAVGDHPVAVAFSSSVVGATNTEVIVYIIKVTTGGASGTAQVTISSDTTGEGSAAAAITTATPITLGTKGATVTPTWTGNLTVGQQWTVYLFPPGILLSPVSENFESVTLVMNKAGVKHVMPGAFGTFDIEAEAGQYAKVNFDFQGIYVDPVDEALSSTLTYETSIPAMVEKGKLRIDGFNAIVNRFTIDMAVDIQPRPDVSSPNGYIGIRIVARQPEGGIDPEADLVASHDFWGKLSAATRMPFSMRVGSVVGNIVHMIGTSVQYSGLTYADRNNILTYDAGLRFSGIQGNDEFLLFFG